MSNWLGLKWEAVTDNYMESERPFVAVKFYRGQYFGWFAELTMEDVKVCGFAKTRMGAKRDITAKLRMLGSLAK